MSSRKGSAVSDSPVKNNLKQQVVIVGMYRSGMSSVSGALVSMGLFAGGEEDLSDRFPDNAAGSFEHKDVRDICDALLSSSRAEWWKVAGFDPDTVDDETVATQLRKFEKLAGELDENSPWILKEPRLSLLLPFFDSCLSAPVVLIVLRNPVEIARSLRRRSGIPLTVGLALWETYILHAVRSAAPFRHFFIQYEDIISSPREALQNLGSDLSLAGINGLDVAAGVEAIDPSLRHETCGPDDIRSLMSPEQKDIWDALCAGTTPKVTTLSERSRVILEEFEADEIARDQVSGVAAMTGAQPGNPSQSSAKSPGGFDGGVSSREGLADKIHQQADRILSLERAAEARSDLLELLLSRLESGRQDIEGRGQGLRSRLELEASLAELRAENATLMAELRGTRQAMQTSADSEGQVDLPNVDSGKRVVQLSPDLGAGEGALIRAEMQLIRKDNLIASLETRLELVKKAEADIQYRLEEKSRHFQQQIDKLNEEINTSKSRAGELTLQNERTLEDLYRTRHELEESKRFANDLISKIAALDETIKEQTQNPVSRLVQSVLDRKRKPNQREQERILRNTPLLDRKWYLQEYPDVDEKKVDPVVHYLRSGARELRNPHLLFDTRLYLERNPAALKRDINPVVDYLTSMRGERRSPHPLFDGDWYLDNNPDVASALMNPLEHFLMSGAFEGRAPHPDFDSKWYIETYSDVARKKVNPLFHFLRRGASEGRDPSPNFSVAEYLRANPDVERMGINPLLHFVLRGRAEGRGPGGSSSSLTRLVGQTSESKGREGNASGIVLPLRTSRSAREGRPNLEQIFSHDAQSEGDESLPSGPIGRVRESSLEDDLALLTGSELFDEHWYLHEYKDVMRKKVDPLRHFYSRGGDERRNPSPMFDTGWYMDNYKEVAIAGVNPLIHFITVGHAKGYRTMPEPAVSMWWDKFSNSANLNSEPSDLPRLHDAKTIAKRAGENAAPLVIVIPAYNAPDELMDCLSSVEKFTFLPKRVVVIDDCSPDERVQRVLDKFQNADDFEIYRNDENLGFTRTINRGLELADRSDVIILNADTIVTPNWDRQLRFAAYSDERVGTATPFSNNAGAFSAPEAGRENCIPDSVDLNSLARAVSQASLREYPRTPTGNGFCMYIRRDCLDEVGLLDAEAFPRGYGEENDFCMKAGDQGWEHVVDDASYVYHVRSASFGDEKSELIKKGRAIIDERHPQYKKAVTEFLAAPEMVRARARVGKIIDAISQDDAAVKPRVLYVLPSLSDKGGTPQTNRDLMSVVTKNVEAFVLRSNGLGVTLYRYAGGEYVPVEWNNLSSPIEAFPHRSDDYDTIVAEWLSRYAIDIVHIRHLAWHGLGLVEVAKALGVPVLYSVHDFYTVCPTVKLLDENLVHCGGQCTSTNGECSPELWPSETVYPLKNENIHSWKKQHADVLEKADCLITTVERARSILQQNYPGLSGKRFEVIPHGRDFAAMVNDAAAELNPDEKIRLVIPGNIGFAKGANLVADIASKAGDHGLEIHILGNITQGEVPPECIVHGSYRREEFSDKVREINPHIGAVLSIWPETYCHTLTELLATGIPVIGLDFGAVGERLMKSEAGWVLPDPTADAFLEVISGLRADPSQHASAIEMVARWQAEEGAVQDNAHMAAEYLNLYNEYTPIAEEAVRPEDLRIAFSEPESFIPQVDAGLSHPFEQEPTEDVPAFATISPQAVADGDMGLISVIVPVHNALEDVRDCVESILANSFPTIELVIVDDGSDAETAEWLRDVASRYSCIKLERHEQARGYTIAVNKGAELASGDFLVIQNSDTIVPPFWLERLIAPMLSNGSIASTGPLSNAATWQSVPSIKSQDGGWAINELPEGVSVTDYDRFIQRQARGLKSTPVKLLNGFCYAVRADVFDALKGLDGEAFPSGYGEETDFFMRLGKAGLQAAIVPNLYVFHAKSKSFGSERRNRLSAQGNEILYQKYTKESIIEAANTLAFCPALMTLRERCQQGTGLAEIVSTYKLRIAFCMPVKPGGGGVHSVIQEAHGLAERGHDVRVLIMGEHLEHYRHYYPAQAEAGLFLIYADEDDLVSKLDHASVCIATHFKSVRLLRKVRARSSSKLFVYYVQDYEPWIINKDSELFAEAYASYGELDGAVLVAKTNWICRKVHEQHNIQLNKIAPSIDQSIYNLDGRDLTSPREPLNICAMVRPNTPRRGPTETLSVMRSIAESTSRPLKFTVFGCSHTSLARLGVPEGLKVTNAGVLVREEVSELLKQNDLFIDMSTYQAFGRTAVEAMACGAVAVIPEFGGGGEYSMAGRACLAVPTQDVSRSAALIVDLINDSNRFEEMRSWGIVAAQQFSISKACKSFEEVIFRQIIK